MYRPVNNDRSFSGTCLAESFAKAYAEEHPDVDVGIIPCADGGNFLYLVSDEPQNPKRMYRLRRDGYIALRKNKRNLALLQAFFSGNIE